MRASFIFYIFILLPLSVAGIPANAAQKQEASNATATASPFGFNELILSAGDQKLPITGEQLRDLASIETVLKINSAERSEIENIDYCPTDKILCRLLYDTIQMNFLGKETKISVNNDAVRSLVETMSEKFDKDPVDAKFSIGDNGIVDFAASQDGIAIDVDKSIEVISEKLTAGGNPNESKEISLPYDTTEPKIKSSQAGKLGIDTLIGEGTSNFRGSPKNRVFNINVATEKFNGVLIKPGEEFSIVKTLGTVDG
jgi:vancomycin resistance protein YoaR